MPALRVRLVAALRLAVQAQPVALAIQAAALPVQVVRVAAPPVRAVRAVAPTARQVVALLALPAAARAVNSRCASRLLASTSSLHSFPLLLSEL